MRHGVFQILITQFIAVHEFGRNQMGHTIIDRSLSKGHYGSKRYRNFLDNQKRKKKNWAVIIKITKEKTNQTLYIPKIKTNKIKFCG